VSQPSAVERHYGQGGLLDRVLRALRDGGHDVDHLDADALAMFEEFHMLGRAGTVALASAARVTAADHVLDVGCGIAGPARRLAAMFGCRVTGVDLTEEFVAVARDLNRRFGVDDLVDVRRGDALSLPFEDASFDVVWSQHAAMNIADKRTLYAEMRRVARRGARLAIFDIVAAPGGADGVEYPLPWASEPAESHLVPAADIRALVESAGFAVTTIEEPSGEVAAFFAQRTAAPPTPLGPQLLMGDSVGRKLDNLERSFRDGRLQLLRLVAVAGG
jgi:SAM-dependent methyltransferase